MYGWMDEWMVGTLSMNIYISLSLFGIDLVQLRLKNSIFLCVYKWLDKFFHSLTLSLRIFADIIRRIIIIFQSHQLYGHNSSWVRFQSTQFWWNRIARRFEVFDGFTCLKKLCDIFVLHMDILINVPKNPKSLSSDMHFGMRCCLNRQM